MAVANLHQVHRPTQKSARIFLAVAILIAVGMLAWTFYFNRGPILVSGPAPFSVEVAGKSINCEKSPCGRKLTPGTYVLTAKKEGYFESKQSVTVARGQLFPVKLAFVFIPIVEEKGPLVLPFAQAPLVPEFIGKEKISGLPSDAEKVLISPNNRQLIFYQKKQVSLLQIDTEKVRATPFGGEDIAVWGGNNLFVLRKHDQGHRLIRWDGKQEVPAVSFPRAFVAPEVFGAPSGNFVLIKDIEKEKSSYYVVDLQQKTRKMLTIKLGGKNISVTANYIITQEASDVVAYHYQTFDRTVLSAVDVATVSEPSPGEFLFVSYEDLENAQRGVLGMSLGDAIEKTQEDISNNLLSKSAWYLTKFTVEGEEYRNIAKINAPDGGKITRLHESADGIYFVRDGNWGRVKLKPE